MIHVNSLACPQNHHCPLVRVCPADAITQKGFGLPQIDEEKCIECGKCISYCPMSALEKKTKNYVYGEKL